MSKNLVDPKSIKMSSLAELLPLVSLTFENGVYLNSNHGKLSNSGWYLRLYDRNGSKIEITHPSGIKHKVNPEIVSIDFIGNDIVIDILDNSLPDEYINKVKEIIYKAYELSRGYKRLSIPKFKNKTKVKMSELSIGDYVLIKFIGEFSKETFIHRSKVIWINKDKTGIIIGNYERYIYDGDNLTLYKLF